MNMLNYSVLLHDWKRPFCWERLRPGGEGAAENEMVGWHHRFKGHESGRPGMLSLSLRIGRPGMLKGMGSQIAGYN